VSSGTLQLGDLYSNFGVVVFFSRGGEGGRRSEKEERRVSWDLPPILGIGNQSLSDRPLLPPKLVLWRQGGYIKGGTVI